MGGSDAMSDTLEANKQAVLEFYGFALNRKGPTRRSSILAQFTSSITLWWPTALRACGPR